MISKLGGRKFLFAVFVTALAFVLVLNKLVGAEEWMKFVEIVAGSYVVGNVASKFSTEVRK